MTMVGATHCRNDTNWISAISSKCEDGGVASLSRAEIHDESDEEAMMSILTRMFVVFLGIERQPFLKAIPPATEQGEDLSKLYLQELTTK